MKTKNWDKKHFGAIVILDIGFLSAVLASNVYVLGILAALIIVSSLVMIAQVWYKLPHSDPWNKPTWWPIYDFATDGLFIAVSYMYGLYTFATIYLIATMIKVWWDNTSSKEDNNGTDTP